NKESMGASFGLKLPGNLKLTPAYSYLKVKRERGDFPENVDHAYSADLKWDGLDYLTAKLGYERLNRSGDWKQIILVTGTQATSNALEPYIRRFDIAPVEKDTFRASVEYYPLENLNMGIGYRHNRSNFKDTVMGIREDKSDEINVDISYEVGTFLKLSAYYDYERTKSFQFQRRANAATVTAAQANPAAVPTATYYNWDLEQSFTTDGFGFGADYFVIPKKLTLAIRYDSVKSDGLADYNIQWLAAGMTNDNVDVNNWEDYRKQSFQAKAVYNATKSLDLTLGYAYERYEYSDALYDGYKYIATTSTGNVNNYLTGAYSNPPYDAHRLYAGVTYKF
ncbi:MAG: MtrB/PioB family outer membrane beta-barrel protein, partial [Smithellaceae bacterium]|nr:MtrB/PioB family outer membrane beta-barrel protein [Smithellaceae bacterium]